MTKPVCEEIAGRFVDYADGELPRVESTEIAEHVARCDRCRARLGELRRSLELARVIWENNEAALTAMEPKTAATEEPARAATRWWRLVPLAAAAALLIGVGLLQYPSREPARPPVRTAQAAAPMDIEYEIARAAVASQLLTAADLLAEQPGGEEYACQRYRYIVAAYANSPAALESLDRLQSSCNQRVGQ